MQKMKLQTTADRTEDDTDWALGPGSVTWSVLKDPPVFIVGLLREALLLALHPLGQLGQEAAPGEPMPERSWNGITIGVNVESTEAVDEAFRSALAAGARTVAGPVKREWGGYSGYFADPEGNRWEIAWAPGS